MKHADFLQGCKEAARHWGTRMPMMAIEECSELSRAICKVERAFADRPDIHDTYPDRMQDLIDEMGDVLISIEALKQYYRISDAQVEMRIEQKLKKQYPVETHATDSVSRPLHRIFEEE